MSSKKNEGFVPGYLLERYLLRELPPGEMVAIEQKLTADSTLTERLCALQDDNEEQALSYPVAWMAGQIEHKAAQLKPKKRRSAGYRLWAMPMVAVAVALAVVVLPTLRQDSEEFVTRIKGDRGPALLVFRQSEDGPQHLPDSSLAYLGDLVQLVYRSGGRSYGAIFSLDGRFSLTRHLPVEGGQAVALVAGRADTLAFAYELDDAPRWERFYLITAEKPFALEEIERLLRQLARAGDPPELVLSPQYDTAVFTLRKPDAP